VLRIADNNKDIDSANILMVKLDFAIIRKMKACFSGFSGTFNRTSACLKIVSPDMLELLESVGNCKKTSGYYYHRKGYVSTASEDCHAVLNTKKKKK